MSVLLVFPAFLLLVVLVTIMAHRPDPRQRAKTHQGRPILRTLLFLVGALIAMPIMALVGFAGVGKRLQ